MILMEMTRVDRESEKSRLLNYQPMMKEAMESVNGKKVRRRAGKTD